MQSVRKARIESIDLLRGLVIILMALDHVRMYFGEGGFYADPTNLDTTTPLLFFTRWITHFCAPVFIFLAGTSAALYGASLAGAGQPNTRDVSHYVLTRGLWLIFLEFVIVNFGWTFDPTFSFHFLQVIWAIGASMVVLAGLVYLPKWAICAFGLILVFGHNLLDPIQMQGTSPQAILWYILHQEQLVEFGPNAAVYFHYPLIPLVGLMALGYVFGTLYRPGFDPAHRRKWLLGMGTVAVALFLVLRAFNLYGEPSPWSPQPTLIYSIMSFLNTTKYPTSLQYLLMTMGPALVFLALTEAVKNRVSETVLVFGRVSLFFYIVHIYLIHSLALVGLAVAGRSLTDWVITAEAFLSQSPSDAGYPLYVVYLVWALVLVAMYAPSRWYRGYKKAHPERWLLRYV
jgi:uncharacterized membrane protein